MYGIGTLVMWTTWSLSAVAESVRLRTCVVPREMSKSLLCKDAVVMIDEKPESFASWMAVWGEACGYGAQVGGHWGYIPYCPREDAPPIMTMGWFAYLPRPPSSKGGVRANPWGC